MTDKRVLFAGTPEFALASLRALVEHGVRPVAVLTQPDRPAGRGKRLTSSPVKRYAKELDIPVLQPTTLKDADAVAEIESHAPDILIVAAYGLILPQRVLDAPTLGCLNVHASLLPRWRGAAPIQAAILAGDAETGISLMSMTAGLDCGPVYAMRATPIGHDETAGELHERLAALGGELLTEKLDDIVGGRVDAVEQDDALATYANKFGAADARLDWSLPAAELERRVRAFNPVPGAWFMHDEERVKCWRAVAVDASGAPGRVLSASTDGVVVACGSGGLSLASLQRPGRRTVTAAQYAAGMARSGSTLH